MDQRRIGGEGDRSGDGRRGRLAGPDGEDLATFDLVEATPDPVWFLDGDGVVETWSLHRTRPADLLGSTLTVELLLLALEARRWEEDGRLWASTRGANLPRVLDSLGLGADSGPAGLILVVIGIAIGVFALGTLIYTALAIALAPQVVMFVGLTRATFGLDHVRPGGDRDPQVVRSGQRPFRWLTRLMLAGISTGTIGLVLFVLVAQE